ncbi:hypothetical protein ONS96_009954 [Cadophora gregata f. sp. sojae]|nr:hypothetical protein ONS96_009954 [Cadophora gregata f. sp. sojae]
MLTRPSRLLELPNVDAFKKAFRATVKDSSTWAGSVRPIKIIAGLADRGVWPQLTCIGVELQVSPLFTRLPDPRSRPSKTDGAISVHGGHEGSGDQKLQEWSG